MRDRVAEPVAGTTACEPITVPPSENVTVPVTEPPIAVPPAGETMAVKLSGAPSLEGLRLEVTVVEVAICFIVSMIAVEVLAALFVSPG